MLPHGKLIFLKLYYERNILLNWSNIFFTSLFGLVLHMTWNIISYNTKYRHMFSVILKYFDIILLNLFFGKFD